MSKEEESMYSERLHIPMVLGRMSTSASSVEMFQQNEIDKMFKEDLPVLYSGRGFFVCS